MTGEPKKHHYSSVKNYYKMSDSEIDTYIKKMNKWLFDQPRNHEEYSHVSWAHKVACRAREIDKNDPFIIDLINSIT